MKLKISILLAILLHFVYPGYIDTRDYYMDFINSQYCRLLRFPFKLESGLGAGSFIQLKFPTPINQIHTAVSDISMKIYQSQCIFEFLTLSFPMRILYLNIQRCVVLPRNTAVLFAKSSIK